MPYYKQVLGIESTKLAQAEHINLIQSHVNNAFVECLSDLFGNGCILDDDEEALKVTPTPYHIDASNKNFENENDYISFYDRYLRQEFETNKSEIQSFNLKMHNTSNLKPTIFAEIRDTDMNFIAEAHTELPITTGETGPADVKFIFNLKHQPTSTYYFVLRPIDISATDFNDVSETIVPDMFTVKFDRSGSLNQGLYASYNGVDYLQSNMLDDQVTLDTGEYSVSSDVNYDLYFEEVFSNGNTYTIDKATCLVNGEKVMPIDTHVVIDGPSKGHNRIDLVTLDIEGHFNVTEGVPFIGQATEDKYPTNDLGLKVAYITTYANSADTWTCPNCNTVNDGNVLSCVECDTTTNNKIPLIEQSDENGKTRQRDLMERIRRLEKKVDYQIKNNTPSRVKYTCAVDPTIATAGEVVRTEDGGEIFVAAEDKYNIQYETNENGENVAVFRGTNSETFAWSIIKEITTKKVKKVEGMAKMSTTDISIPAKKPKKPKDSQYYTLNVKRRETKTIYKKQTSEDGVERDDVTSYYTSAYNIPIDLYIIKIVKKEVKSKNAKDKKIKEIQEEKKIVEKIKNKRTNANGNINIDLWNYKLSKGKYYMVAKYDDKKLTSVIYIDQDDVKLEKRGPIEIKISEKPIEKTSVNVQDNVFTGNDSFYTKNMKVDEDIGEVSIETLDTSSLKKEDWMNIPKEKQTKDANVSKASFKIDATNTCEYCMYSFDVDHDCIAYNITPFLYAFENIKAFKIVLFENPKIFEINNTRTSYEKFLDKDKAEKTVFKNLYESDWIKVKGASKDSKVKVSEKKQTTFDFGQDGILLKKGVYSIVFIGALYSKKKEGKIYIEEYHTSKATKYGGISYVYGSYNPNKIYIQKNGLRNRAIIFKMNRALLTHYSSGTLVSRIIETQHQISSCKIKPNYEIPPGCDVFTYVSNNGGRTYVETKDNSNTVTFPGLGSQFRWRITFNGTALKTPKLKFNGKYAIKFELSEKENYITYEDYGRCFATPILNANTITRSVALNNNIKNKFAEWEFARLWMEDEDLASNMDICFAYDNKNYDTTVEHTQKEWPNSIFFSQVLGNLTLEDFDQTSIDYSNYDADTEPDENNFRLKYDTDMANTGDIIVATPLANEDGDRYNYSYGNINVENNDMENFTYSLTKNTTLYKDNTNDVSNKYSGVHLVTGSYYQALYNKTTNTTESTKRIWASDGGDPTYDPEACIIGVQYQNGLEITDNYTSLTVDIFANLRDHLEQVVASTTTTTSEEGEPENSTSNPADQLSDIGILQYENGEPVINTNRTIDQTKYMYEDKCYYIPQGTLELVVSLNPNGLIEENNATYGKVYTVDIPIRSCKHTPFTINLSDLYGSTIYSIGLRVNKTVVEKAEDGVLKHPSLHEGDILALGNISLNGENIKPYTPYIYSGDTNRWNWTALDKTQVSTAYVLYESVKPDNTEPRMSYLPIYKLGDPAGKYSYPYPGTGDNIQYSDPVFHNGTLNLYEQDGTALILRESNLEQISVDKARDSNEISLYYLKENQERGDLFRKSTENANSIMFHINVNDFARGSLFKIDTDVNLTPYDWIEVEYYLEHIKETESESNVMNEYNILKGEVFLDLYDTVDYKNAEPVEQLPLPAWGKTQNNYNQSNKTVHAWFKIHSDAASVKCIVLRTEKLNCRTPADLRLVIADIVFLNTDTVPALGPQMQMRIYPKNESALTNTKIRKFGCVYRLG